MKEDEIRPEALKQGQRERFARDIARLNSRSDEFVAVPCPACGEARTQQWLTKYGFTYVRCIRCGTGYANPRPTSEILADYYAGSENYAYWSEVIYPASEAARREMIVKPRAERLIGLCSSHGVGRGTFVEVGAGFGTFADEIRGLQYFAEVLAIEPTPKLADQCRRRGLNTLQQTIEQVRLTAVADVVASFEVVEHLFDPATFVRACWSMLKPGGVLALSCPNIEGFEIETLREGSDTIEVQHLNYFSRSSLAALVTASGFEVLQVLTPGELDAELVRKKALSGECDLRAEPFLRRVLLDEWERLGPKFQEFLAVNQLSTHMWLVARRSAA